MKKEIFSLFEKYMCSCMDDNAHGSDHVYRVLYNALEIAKFETDVNYDVLICACLLHDIGRKEQFADPKVCHARVGAEKAYLFLKEHHFEEEYALAVRHCIATHRYRANDLPQSIEAKILFDADKLDAAGAIGVARTLLYKGIVSEPLYTLDINGNISNGENDSSPSFFQEYKFKLEKVYADFYTKRGSELAAIRKQAAVDFYESLLCEVKASFENGKKQLDLWLE